MITLEKMEKLADGVSGTSLGGSDAEALAYAVQDLIPLLRAWLDAHVEWHESETPGERYVNAEFDLAAALCGERCDARGAVGMVPAPESAWVQCSWRMGHDGPHSYQLVTGRIRCTECGGSFLPRKDGRPRGHSCIKERG